MNKLTKVEYIIKESKSKIKILLDENKLGLSEYLVDAGYRIDVLPQGMTDNQIHQYLIKNNYKLFITQDYDDFEKLNNCNYTIIGIVTREDDLTVARRIINEFKFGLKPLTTSPLLGNTIKIRAVHDKKLK